MRDFLVGSSVAPCNGSIADGRTKWRCPFGRIRCFAMRDVLVSPSAVPCNGNIADGRLKWRCPFGRLRNSRNLRKNRTKFFRFGLSITKLGELIAEGHHYCREFRSINDFGGHVLTPFLDTCPGSVECRSAS